MVFVMFGENLMIRVTVILLAFLLGIASCITFIFFDGDIIFNFGSVEESDVVGLNISRLMVGQKSYLLVRGHQGASFAYRGMISINQIGESCRITIKRAWRNKFQLGGDFIYAVPESQPCRLIALGNGGFKFSISHTINM